MTHEAAGVPALSDATTSDVTRTWRLHDRQTPAGAVATVVQGSVAAPVSPTAERRNGRSQSDAVADTGNDADVCSDTASSAVTGGAGGSKRLRNVESRAMAMNPPSRTPTDSHRSPIQFVTVADQPSTVAAAAPCSPASEDSSATQNQVM